MHHLGSNIVAVAGILAEKNILIKKKQNNGRRHVEIFNLKI